MKSNVTYLQTDEFKDTPFFERVSFGSEISLDDFKDTLFFERAYFGSEINPDADEMFGTFPLKSYYHSILDISSPEQLVQDTKEDLPQSKNCPNVDEVSFR